MGKILLFYKYIHIQYPKRIVKWQKKLFKDLELTGRVFIGHEGINATLGGTLDNVERYKQIMDEHPLFKDIDFKESPGGPECFPRAYITIKHEIVNLGLDPNSVTPQDGGKHLEPEQVHQLIQTNDKDLVILDTRNTYEWKIGKFDDAITPEIDNFRQFPEYVDTHLDQFKDKKVLMYCTGGIRCERATTYLKLKNIAKEVYQIKGGIHRYAEKYPDGFFRGKNYVFDSRIAVKVNDDILAQCSLCDKPCDDYTNCLNTECNNHYICCPTCLESYTNTCSQKCFELVKNKKVKTRKPLVRHTFGQSPNTKLHG